MDDLELIKYAGLAAGIQYSADENPLIDDALALRLAVRMNFEVGIWNQDYCHGDPKIIVKDNRTYDEKITIEAVLDDPYAATRRAIVRAAAEIGRTM